MVELILLVSASFQGQDTLKLLILLSLLDFDETIFAE